MGVNTGFRDYVLEQLGRIVPGVAHRAMFGGVSIHSAGLTFALIDDDILYLKGDASCRAGYDDAGWLPFRPFGPEGSAMAYFAVPGELLESPELLEQWVEIALGAARRAKRPGKKRR